MISPAFLIKILGCATVGAFLTIGVPVIAVKEHAKKVEAAAVKAQVQKRQAEIDKPATLSHFFSNLLASTLAGATNPTSIKAGETFSDTAIEKWSPSNTKEKTDIATNFSSIIKHMPNAFFEKLKDKALTQGEEVCHIGALNITARQKHQQLYIPFLRSELTSTIKDTDQNLLTVQATADGIETHLGQNFLKTDKANFKTELTEIADGTKAPHNRAPASQSSEQEKAIAKDLLFLQTLYEDTIDILTKELKNQDTSPTGGGILWEVSC